MMNQKVLKWLISRLGDSIFNFIGYRYLHRKCQIPVPTIKWNRPVRFNHKLIWLKMNYRHQDASKYADKVLVKEFVSKAISSDIVIPTLAVWSRAEDIDFEQLPVSFILKTNHGSGWNIIVKDKKYINPAEIKKQISIWLSQDYFNLGREYQYKDINPMVLAEPLLTPKDGKKLVDYKFFCFNGEPRFVQADFDRDTRHTRNFYDMSWTQQPFSILYPPFYGEAPKPNQFSEMIAIAKILARGFPFIRVDLYDFEGQVYFGELTFHPEGGFGPIVPDEWDERLGAMLDLTPYLN